MSVAPVAPDVSWCQDITYIATAEGWVCFNNSLTRGSKTVNDVGPGVRSYRGGVDEFTALSTVVREILKRSAIRDFGTPLPPAS